MERYYSWIMIPAESRPDFTGLWKVDLEKSIMLGPVPKEILVRIEHREPTLIQQVLVTTASGKEQQQAFTCDSGAETTNSVSGVIIRTRAKWEGADLVIESWTKMGAREFYFKDHWSLSGDGGTLTMTHRDGDLAGQISVLEKAPQVDKTRFDRLKGSN
jgi:hypothetical protein